MEVMDVMDWMDVILRRHDRKRESEPVRKPELWKQESHQAHQGKYDV